MTLGKECDLSGMTKIPRGLLADYGYRRIDHFKLQQNVQQDKHV